LPTVCTLQISRCEGSVGRKLDRGLTAATMPESAEVAMGAIIFAE